MPRNFRPIIGQHYSGPPLDRALRRMPSHWVLEESQKPITTWWRYLPGAEKLIGILVGAILLFAVISGIADARGAEKQVVRRIEPINPMWSVKRCKAQGRTYLANLSDAKGWKVRCTGRPVRT